MKTPFIESVQVIPMNKETIFEDPYSEEEIFSCSLLYDEWKEKVLPRISQSDRDGFGLDYLKETDEIASKFKGFMFGPIAKYKKDILTAKYRKARSVQEIVDQDFSNCFLYVVGGRLNRFCTHPSPFLLTDEELEDYYVEQYEYIIRYAEIQ